MNRKTSVAGLLPVLFSFFVMGFVDVVGVATSYVKSDFALNDRIANLLPMMVFLWFAVCSLPTGMLMGRIGRKRTVMASAAVTFVAMLLPMVAYSFPVVLTAFALLGIGNTMLQVSLNPLLADVAGASRATSMLTLGQFIKAICSMLGPVLVGVAAGVWGNWRLIFLLYAGKSSVSCPLKPKRFYPLKTFNNAPLKSLDRWGYYYFSLFPSVCSHFTDTFSCQLNPVRRMYNTIHNGICYCRVSDCIIPIVRWQLRGDDDGLAPMSVLYYIEQDGSFLGIKVHKEEVIQYEQRAPFDSLEFRFQCAFYFCHLKRTHKFRSIRIICPYALLAGFIPHCCGKEALPGTG